MPRGKCRLALDLTTHLPMRISENGHYALKRGLISVP